MAVGVGLVVIEPVVDGLGGRPRGRAPRPEEGLEAVQPRSPGALEDETRLGGPSDLQGAARVRDQDALGGGEFGDAAPP